MLTHVAEKLPGASERGRGILIKDFHVRSRFPRPHLLHVLFGAALFPLFGGIEIFMTAASVPFRAMKP